MRGVVNWGGVGRYSIFLLQWLNSADFVKYVQQAHVLLCFVGVSLAC